MNLPGAWRNSLRIKNLSGIPSSLSFILSQSNVFYHLLTVYVTGHKITRVVAGRSGGFCWQSKYMYWCHFCVSLVNREPQELEVKPLMDCHLHTFQTRVPLSNYRGTLHWKLSLNQTLCYVQVVFAIPLQFARCFQLCDESTNVLGVHYLTIKDKSFWSVKPSISLTLVG